MGKHGSNLKSNAYKNSIFHFISFGFHPNSPPFCDFDMFTKYISDTLCKNEKQLFLCCHFSHKQLSCAILKLDTPNLTG